MTNDISLSRDVEAIQIPSGDTVLLPLGTKVIITQSLGGSYTVATEQGLARISAKNADALGMDKATLRPEQTGEKLSGAALEAAIWVQLKQVFDPEIPVNIVDLGLVYDCSVEPAEGGDSIVNVKMTLTAPGCGMGPTIAADAQSKIMVLNGVENALVEIVWEPCWQQDMISEAGKMQLGMI